MVRTYKVTLTEGQLMLVRLAVHTLRKSHPVTSQKAARLFEVEQALDKAEPNPSDFGYDCRCQDCGEFYPSKEGHTCDASGMVPNAKT